MPSSLSSTHTHAGIPLHHSLAPYRTALAASLTTAANPMHHAQTLGHLWGRREENVIERALHPPPAPTRFRVPQVPLVPVQFTTLKKKQQRVLSLPLQRTSNTDSQPSLLLFTAAASCGAPCGPPRAVDTSQCSLSSWARRAGASGARARPTRGAVRRTAAPCDRAAAASAPASAVTC